MLSRHHVDTLRRHAHAIVFAHLVSVIVLHLYLIAVRSVKKHLIMHTLEDAGTQFTTPLTLLRISVNHDILRTNHHVHLLLPRNSIDAFEVLIHKPHRVISVHLTIEDIALANKISHKRVGRLIINILRSANLLHHTVIHHHHSVRQSQSLLLIMSDEDESDTQPFVHLPQLHLHILAHLSIESRERFIEQQHLRLIDNSTRNSDTLLLTARERIDIPLLLVSHRHHLASSPHLPYSSFFISKILHIK